MQSIPSLLIETPSVITFVFVIFGIALYQYLKFAKAINPLIDEFTSINAKLKSSGPDKSDFCAFYDTEFDDLMKSTKYLKDGWREFNETLLLPGQDFESDGEDRILNTHHTSIYFNQRYILWPKIDMRWFNALPNILTGMGILGTFIGLVAGIYIASPGLSADSMDEAKEALNTLLSGASLAFLTSIAGLTSSMLFSKLEKLKVHHFDQLCTEFVGEIDQRVEYFSAERLSNKALQESKKQSYALETFANDLAISMGQIMQEHVSGPLVQAIENLAENQKSANDETIQKVMEEFAASISGAAGVEMQALADTIETISKKLEEQLLALSSGHSAMKDTAEDIITNMTRITGEAADKINGLSVELENAVNAQQDLNRNTIEVNEHVKETVFKVGNVLESARDVFENADSLVKKQTEILSKSENIAQDFSKTAQSIAETHQLIVSTQENIKQSWKDYKDRFTNVDESVAELFNKINDGMSQYANSTKDYLIELDKHAAKVVKELAFASKEISESIENLSDGLDQQRIEFLQQAKNSRQ